MRKVLIGALIALVAGISGCSVIDDGNFAITKSAFTSKYTNDILEPGISFTGTQSVYEINGKAMQYQISDLRPKDKDGVMLVDLDITITVKVNPTHKVIEFVKTNSDLKRDSGYYIVGREFIIKDARSFIGEVVRKFSSDEILDKRSEFENVFVEEFQKEMNRLYGEKTFVITDMKIANIQVSPIIENRIQSIANINAEEAKNAATRSILKGRKEVMVQEATILKEAANEAGITIDQMLRSRLIDAIRDGANVQVITTTD